MSFRIEFCISLPQSIKNSANNQGVNDNNKIEVANALISFMKITIKSLNFESPQYDENDITMVCDSSSKKSLDHIKNKITTTFKKWAEERLNIDKLTYQFDIKSITEIPNNNSYQFFSSESPFTTSNDTKDGRMAFLSSGSSNSSMLFSSAEDNRRAFGNSSSLDEHDSNTDDPDLSESKNNQFSIKEGPSP